MEAEEVFHDGKVRGVHFFARSLPYSGFVGGGKSLLESILFYR
jgi:hypothetical protein